MPFFLYYYILLGSAEFSQTKEPEGKHSSKAAQPESLRSDGKIEAAIGKLLLLYTVILPISARFIKNIIFNELVRLS